MSMTSAGQDRPIEILWEDADFVVVAKPCGVIVDAGDGRGGDLITRLRGQNAAYARVFAFHRLDKETSGVVLLGKTRRFAKEITQSFEEKRIRKAYLAVVGGEWPSGLNRIDAPIEDKPSVTTFRRLALGTFDGQAISLLECLPKTGRTHQIRIHCSGAGHEILGDARYGTAAPPEDGGASKGQALHAYRLDFRHPADAREIAVRCAPDDWRGSWLKDVNVEVVWQKLFSDVTALKDSK